MEVIRGTNQHQDHISVHMITLKAIELSEEPSLVIDLGIAHELNVNVTHRFSILLHVIQSATTHELAKR